jgi:hypothetical protein
MLLNVHDRVGIGNLGSSSKPMYVGDPGRDAPVSYSVLCHVGSGTQKRTHTTRWGINATMLFMRHSDSSSWAAGLSFGAAMHFSTGLLEVEEASTTWTPEIVSRLIRRGPFGLGRLYCMEGTHQSIRVGIAKVREIYFIFITLLKTF